MSQTQRTVVDPAARPGDPATTPVTGRPAPPNGDPTTTPIAGRPAPTNGDPAAPDASRPSPTPGDLTVGPAPTPVATLRGATVSFADREALRGIDLDVQPGCLTVLAGPNGAGKSTLLEVLAGTRPLTAGTRSVTGAVALVPQRTTETDRLPVTVRDVVTVGVWGRLGRWRRLDARARTAIDVALQRLHIQDLATLPFHTLSGGQRQRTLLAQGLARGAEILLLDEPTTGLDSDSAGRIRDIMRAEAERGVAVVCVSHDPLVHAAADRLVHLADGALAP